LALTSRRRLTAHIIAREIERRQPTRLDGFVSASLDEPENGSMLTS
jgi:hypothetical protein